MLSYIIEGLSLFFTGEPENRYGNENDYANDDYNGDYEAGDYNLINQGLSIPEPGFKTIKLDRQNNPGIRLPGGSHGNHDHEITTGRPNLG